ncbi:MAG TPA: DUF1697 domain-containing protein [Acidimicrobiales bacterium]|nr:DUF1697 domain-containing protein [Acidimicrobiales bacterium]
MTRVAFLRAVNVGRRTVAMSRLADVVRGLGYEDAWTYINSGNVVFDATGSREDLERRLERAFEGEFGFEVTTFVRTAAELRRALAVKPFQVRSTDTYFVTFLKTVPSRAQRAELQSLSNAFDTLVVKGRDVHWRMHGKSTDTQLPTKAWESVIGRHESTSRNTSMLRKLIEKIDA